MSFQEIKISSGPRVQLGDRISLLYKLSLTKRNFEQGIYLESTYAPDIPIEIDVVPSGLLSGVYEGLIGMRSGGSIRRFIIPAEKAYGGRGYEAIPPNSSLYIEICVARIVSRNNLGEM